MQKTELKWPDGSKISYKEESNGWIRRIVNYSTGEYVDNAGKYYYLKVLENYKDIGKQTYEDLQYICNLTTSKYEKSVETELCRRFSNPLYGEGLDTSIFMTIIYLAMIDLESEKKYPKWPGKKIVLESCKAVLLENVSYEKAANLFNKTYNPPVNNRADDDFDESDEGIFDGKGHEAFNHSYEKYAGYNGYDDNAIDYGFDGHPEATWNVD